MMTRADAEWLLEALKSAGLTGEIIGSLAVKKQSSHDIDLTITIGHPRDYQTYWHTLEGLGFRYERTDAAPSGEIWVGRSRDGTSLVVDVHPLAPPSPRKRAEGKGEEFLITRKRCQEPFSAGRSALTGKRFLTPFPDEILSSGKDPAASWHKAENCRPLA